MKMQVREFADFTGVSVRTIHYYDEIGLLKPARVDEQTGYRFYDEKSVLRMQEILFYRELDFSLKSIAEMLSSPKYDAVKALKEHKKLLILKKERLERLISAVDDAVKGETVVNAFDNTKFEKYKAEAKEKWGKTEAYKEHEEKTQHYSAGKWNDIAEGMNAIFADFAACMKNGAEAASKEVQALVEALQNYISENFYQCTNEILSGLGQMYTLDERFRNNIDKHACGTAEFVRSAIEIYSAK